MATLDAIGAALLILPLAGSLYIVTGLARGPHHGPALVHRPSHPPPAGRRGSMGIEHKDGRPADRGGGVRSLGTPDRGGRTVAGIDQLWPEGRMFWLSWNRLVGSYRSLTATRRAYVSGG